MLISRLAMRSRVIDQRKKQAHNNAAIWPAIVFAIAVVVWTVAMMAFILWQFFDRFTVGRWDGHIGMDFFQIPRGYNNLLIGNSIFLTDAGTYGPYASSYLNHPFLAVAVGPWTAPLAPWTAFWLFVVVSLGLLLLSAWLLASAFPAPAYRGFAYFAMFCSLPTYAMLWNAQAHVLLVVAVALILSGLMRLAEEPQLERRYCRWIQLGLVISLLSKPVVVLMLPVLFLLPETRRKLLFPVAVYAVVSLLFLLVGRLNPGGYNGTHWLNIVSVTSSPTKPVDGSVLLVETNLLRCPEFYSLPIFLGRILGGSVPALFLRLPLVAPFAMSLSPLVLAGRERRLRAAIVTVLLCILSHFLCYYRVLEHHYTALLPMLPVLLWLWRRESVPWFRRLLMASFVVSLLVFVPTPRFLSPNQPDRFQTISLLQRVVPVAVAFLCLTVYGLASVWLRRRRPRLITRQMIDRMWPRFWEGVVLGILLGSVLVAACLTVPSRLWRMPSQWSPEDFREHYDECITELQRAVETAPTCAAAHINLGLALVKRGRLDEGIAHYRKALEIDPGAALVHNNLGVALAELGRFDEAIVHCQEALKNSPQAPADVHFNLAFALSRRGRLDEAIAHYRQGLEMNPDDATARGFLDAVLAGRGRLAESLAQFEQAVRSKPDDVDAQISLAWLRATCVEASLRDGAAAIKHAERAIQLCEGRRVDALAAAYAEAGRFPEALAAAQEALELATQQNNRALADVLQARISLYEAGKPYRQPLSLPASPSPKP